MRLTLRTLLAYLDDVLDPVDKEELAKKIESSEFAEDLVHRTRDTVRRLRLSAPQVIGTGMGLDPNTVAEYLDNVMPPEQVGDFERICLESDVHLAEATACHHVLTMILGSPADVDPLARQRMYSIANEAGARKQFRAEPAHMPQATAAAATTPAHRTPMPTSAAPVQTAQRPAVEVPDYLRAGPWWRSTTAVVGLAAVVLLGIGVLLYTSLPSWLGIKSGGGPLVAGNSPAATAPATNNMAPPPQLPPTDTLPAPANNTNDTASTPPLAPPPQPLTPSMPAANGNSAAASSAALAGSAVEGDRYAIPATPPAAPPLTTAPPTENNTAATPAAPAASDANMPANGAATPANGIAPAGAAAATAANTPATPPTDATALLPPAPPLSSAAGSTLPPPTDTAPAATPPANALAAAGANVPNGTTESPAPPTPPQNNGGDSAAPPAAAAPATAAVPPATPPDSGKYMGGKTVLLRFDDKAGTWFRVESRAAIVPGQRVLSLPEFRPRIALASGLQLDLSGGTQVVMGGSAGVGLPSATTTGGVVPPAEAGSPAAAAASAKEDVTPSLEVVYGRIVLANPTNAERPIRLRLGPSIGTAKLGPNATLGVEVERKHVPGQDPRQAAAPVETRLFAPDGNVVWVDSAGEKMIDKPSRWTLTDAGAANVTADSAPPEWIDHEPIVQLSEQRYGAPVIESTLVATSPAETQLLELFQGSSRKEVKSLVARSSIHVGLFQPFIDALRDSEQKANWKTHIDTLRMAMALSPESANKVYQALVDQRGKPVAADLFEMLCGYTPEQIGQTPEAQKTGSISRLINWLEDDSLDYRVLAVQDLWEITGKRLMPNPAASLAERTQNVRRWRSRLEAGELKPVAAKE